MWLYGEVCSVSFLTSDETWGGGQGGGLKPFSLAWLSQPGRAAGRGIQPAGPAVQARAGHASWSGGLAGQPAELAVGLPGQSQALATSDVAPLGCHRAARLAHPPTTDTDTAELHRLRKTSK